MMPIVSSSKSVSREARASMVQAHSRRTEKGGRGERDWREEDGALRMHRCDGGLGTCNRGGLTVTR